MQKFKPQNSTQYFLLPPSVEDFIKEDQLARVIDEVVDTLILLNESLDPGDFTVFNMFVCLCKRNKLSLQILDKFPKHFLKLILVLTCRFQLEGFCYLTVSNKNTS
ncbi:MAG TPA: hypothetical protein VGP55_00740 [Chitinophagaceae bacterium]|nr:hypothetical protein [Chitinophagaceae bacterium]